MKPQTKKALAIGGATILGLLLFLAYREYKKIMSYTIKLVRFQRIKISTSQFIFDIFVEFKNFSNVPVNVTI